MNTWTTTFRSNCKCCCLQVQRKGKSEKIKQRQSKVGFAGTTKHVSRFVVHGGTRQVSFKSSTASQVQFYVGTAAAYVPLSKTGSYVRSDRDRKRAK